MSDRLLRGIAWAVVVANGLFWLAAVVTMFALAWKVITGP